MFAHIVRWALRLYPADWRERFGDELVATAAQLDAGRERSRVAMLAGILAGGMQAWIELIRRSRGHRAVLGLGGAAMVALAAGLVILSSAGPLSGDPVLADARGDAPISRQQAQADVLRLCGPTVAGKRVTFVDMDPNTGRVLAKATHKC